MQENSDVSDIKRDVLQALRAAAEKQAPVILSPKDKPVSLFSLIENVSDEFITIRNSIPPLMAPFLLGARSFQILSGSYWIGCDNLVPHGRDLRIPVVNFGRIEMARVSERVCFSANEDVRARIAHPFDAGTFLLRRVYDLSEGGMSFRSRFNTPFMQTGRILPSIEILFNGVANSVRSGQVVYVKQIIDVAGNDYFQVGVRFENEEEPAS